ncbi:hypothetical protein Acr_00g0071020 [Actinidia rufa]|uniref:Uncharacterized protein n=1 Tax=Actinidia rufa TaxID=165716 RepID=A0A7J0DSS8_9ERIC|nr:hypothetical protein Acr_00g0071020 [Actinidia rufa]
MFEHNGLSYFDTDVSYNVALQSSTFAFQDHCRLGHSTLSSLKKLVPLCQSQSLSTLPCEVCKLSKRCCTSFYLHAESRVLHPFHDHDIIHQSSCVWTPQQNGVTKLKLRHLLDVVPKSFWSDVVLTACYLMNRMPSAVLGGLIPHRDILVPKKVISVIPLLSAISLCVDIIFNEALPYFTTPQLFPPLDYYLPTIFSTVPPRLENPLQVYVHLKKSTTAPALAVQPSSPARYPFVPSVTTPNSNSLHKGKRSCTAHPLAHFVSYASLSSSFLAFIGSISTTSISKSISEALIVPHWRQAMANEMTALHDNGTWQLVLVGFSQ